MAKHLQEMRVTRIDLLRHGECEGGDIFRGHFDAALSSAGHVQMQKACDPHCSPWQVVFSSPLQRCWRFAQGLTSAPVSDARLQEMSFGDWDGRQITDVWREDHARISAWSRNPATNTPPNGEPLAQVAARVGSFINESLQQHSGKHLLFITHGGIIRVLLCQVLGMPLAHANRWQVPYGCFTQLAVYEQPLNKEPPLFQLVCHNSLVAQ